MASPNLGPQWVWGCGAIMAAIGIFAVLAGIVYGIVWLLNHVSIH